MDEICQALTMGNWGGLAKCSARLSCGTAGWVIAVAVVIVLLVLGCIGFLIFWFMCRRRKYHEVH